MPDHSSEEITYTVGGQSVNGYLATPASGAGKGVLVLHAWWGLNDTIRTVCTRLADAGFVAFAPDLYHGKLTDTIEGAEALVKELNARSDQAMAETVGAVSLLNERIGQNQGIGVVGFSLGASYALDLSAAAPEHVRSVVLFYGTGGGDFSTSKATYLGHFAEEDPYEPLEWVDEFEASLRDAGRPVTFYRYNGAGHWFFEPDRADAFNQEAADLAWERTIAFLNATL